MNNYNLFSYSIKSVYFSHGTRCAGEIAAQADNGICGMGIAYDCNIGGN